MAKRSQGAAQPQRRNESAAFTPIADATPRKIAFKAGAETAYKCSAVTVQREGTTIYKTIVLSAVSVSLLGSVALLAQAQPAPPAPPAVISFFVAENANQTGNLGGLTG